MLDGFAYQSPPPSYCRRATVSRGARLAPERGMASAASEGGTAQTRVRECSLVCQSVGEIARSAELSRERRGDVARAPPFRAQRRARARS